MSDLLCHFGIKGMKWGIRRFQNKNGSLTAAGKKRYQKGEQASDEKTPPSSSASRSKSISELSDTELRTRINRLNLEKQYRQLLSEGASSNTKQVREGKSFANEIKDRAVKNVFLPAAEEIGRQVVRSTLAEFTNKAFKFEGDKMVFANNKRK